MKYKAVIFDLDGTLLDTIDDISDSVNVTLRERNYHEFTVEEYKYFVGRGVDELISSVIEKGEIDPLEFDDLKAGYIKAYNQRNNTKTKVYDGIMELLKQLKSKGVNINILSNKPHFQTVDVVKHYFKDIVFDQVYGKLPEFEIKPNPASALDLIAKLHLKPEEVLYVGDTNTDMQTAINANLKKVGVLWGFRTKEELIKAGADYIVSRPEEIIDIIVGE